MSDKDQIIYELQKIRVYAEFLCNIKSDEELSLSGSASVTMGAEILNSIATILSSVDKLS